MNNALYVFDIRGLLFNNNVHLLSFQIPADMILECHSPQWKQNRKLEIVNKYAAAEHSQNQ